MKRIKTLNIQSPRGKFIQCEIETFGHMIRIISEPIPETIADGTNSTEDGQIEFQILKKNYKSHMEKFEQYLTDLFYRSAMNDFRNSSIKPKADRAGDKKESLSSNPPETTGENNPSVGSGGDRDEQTQRPKKRRKPTTKVVKVSDSGFEKSDPSRDETI